MDMTRQQLTNNYVDTLILKNQLSANRSIATEN